jgi:catechol 2,3-dioxygenase-like lactoylglutathione lyase family enzyme
MLDHLALQARDVAGAADFYVRLFGPLGMREIMRYPRGGDVVVGLGGPDGFPRFWLGPVTGIGAREVHVAFTAPTRAVVDEVHESAVALGAEVLHAPRVWPEYHEHYYGVFVRDLDGNNVEAVCHQPA